MLFKYWPVFGACAGSWQIHRAVEFIFVQMGFFSFPVFLLVCCSVVFSTSKIQHRLSPETRGRAKKWIMGALLRPFSHFSTSSWDCLSPLKSHCGQPVKPRSIHHINHSTDREKTKVRLRSERPHRGVR